MGSLKKNPTKFFVLFYFMLPMVLCALSLLTFRETQAQSRCVACPRPRSASGAGNHMCSPTAHNMLPTIAFHWQQLGLSPRVRHLPPCGILLVQFSETCQLEEEKVLIT